MIIRAFELGGSKIVGCIILKRDFIMNIRNKHLTIVAILAVVVVVLGINGCKKSDNTGAKSGTVYAASVQLCTDCGQIKGKELSCNHDQVKCEGCSLAEGSPGCCKLPKLEG